MRWAVAILVVLGASKAADACSFACDRKLTIHTAVSDAGLPTNGNLLVLLPLTMRSEVPKLSLGRADGGDGDGGLSYSVQLLSGEEFGPCERVARVHPEQELMPGTEYRLQVTEPFDGGFGPLTGEIDFVTGSGPDLTPPAKPVVQALQPAEAFCASCTAMGPFGSGFYVQLRGATPGDAVWFAPLSPRIDDHGSEWGFFARAACGPIQGNVSPGPTEIEVIAFDSAWNMSEVTTVTVDTACATIDPCTGKPVEMPDAGTTPLSGGVPGDEEPKGCGCSSASTLAFGLLVPVTRTLRRRRRVSA